MRIRVWLAFGLLALLWGSSYLFIRVGVRHLSPISLVALRLTIASVAILLIAAAQQRVRRRKTTARPLRLRMPKPIVLRLIAVATVNTALPFFLISWGEVNVPSGLASVLNSTVPIFSVLLAGALLHDEPITLAKLGGVAIGFTGVIVLLSRDLGQATIAWSSVAGQLAIVLASLCYAVGAVAVRRTLRGVQPMTIACYSLWVSAAETVAISAIFSRPQFSDMLGETWFAVLWLGVLGSALAYTLAFFILENWGAARYTLVAYMLPVVGLTLGAIFLGESLDWRILAGSALVFGGVLLASNVRRSQLAFRRSRPVMHRSEQGAGGDV